MHLQFSNPQLLPWLRKLATAIRDAGGRAWFVGGAVRDGLLGLVADDADLEVYGLDQSELSQIAARFGTVHEFGKQFAILQLTGPDGKVELALPRRETKTGPGHRGFDVVADPELAPEIAVQRRDFTVNALMQDVLTGQIVDHVGGQRDLNRGVLRHVSPAFAEDPLRALRAARFAARFGWQVARPTSELCRRLDLSELPIERVENEWKRMLLESRWPGHGVLIMEQVGALRGQPEISAMRGVPQDPIWHPEGDVLHHTALALDAGASIREQMEDPWVEMLAILCHDLGKAGETRFERARWRSPMHDETGVDLTKACVSRLSAHANLSERVIPLVREHLRPAQLYAVKHQVKDSAIRRLAARVHIPALVRIAWADGAGRADASNAADWPAGAWLLEAAEQLGVRDDGPTSLLRGQDLLARGVAAGPQVGEVLREAFEAQMDGAFNDQSGALSWLDARLAR